VVFFALSAWYVDGHLIYTATPSLSKRLFFTVTPSNLKKGDYIVFSLTGDRFAPDNEKLLKRITCVAGDTLRVKRRDYYCNDAYLGRAKERTLTGERLENFVYNSLIRKNSFFVMGEHKDSYDSRYYGLVSKDSVLAKAYPLW